MKGVEEKKRKFSVVVPTYNDADLLENLIQNVSEQSYNNWELILVDDGSIDHTEEIVRNLVKDERIKYYKQENEGVAAARNQGVKLAEGKFIVFLDSDDRVNQNWLEDFDRLTKNKSNIGFLSCGYILNEKKNFPRIRSQISREKYSSLAGTFAVKRSVFEAIGGYDPNLKQSENWELTARALEYCENNGLEILSINRCNFFYQHEKSPEQTRKRDENRAESTYYLFNKYSDSGVLHFRKKEFLLASAVNYTRAGKIRQARKMFYKFFSKYPGAVSFSRIIFFEIPFLRNRKWKREDQELEV